MQDQIRQLYGQGSGGQAPKGSEPGEQAKQLLKTLY